MASAKEDAVSDNWRSPIIVWGPIASGKTTYLAALYVAVKNSDGLDIWPGDDASFAYIDAQTELLRKGRFSSPTAFDLFSSPCQLDLIRTTPATVLGSRALAALLHIRRPIHRFAVWDVPGEVCENSLTIEADYPMLGRYKQFCNHLRRPSAVLCFLDLQSERAQFYHEFIRRTLYMLQRTSVGSVNQTVQCPVAWIVSKVDLPERWAYRQDAAEYSHSILGAELIYEMARTCPISRWFALSAVGVRRDNGQILLNYAPEVTSGSNGSEECIIDAAHRVGIGLLDPLHWMLDCVER